MKINIFIGVKNEKYKAPEIILVSTDAKEVIAAITAERCRLSENGYQRQLDIGTISFSCLPSSFNINSQMALDISLDYEYSVMEGRIRQRLEEKLDFFEVTIEQIGHAAMEDIVLRTADDIFRDVQKNGLAEEDALDIEMGKAYEALEFLAITTKQE